jgi:phospholipid-translocating ATPase
MPTESTSAIPLVPRSKRKPPNWFQRNISRPLANFSPNALFHKKKRPAHARSVYINQPLPPDFYDKKGRVLKDKVYTTNQNVTSKYTIITFLPRNLLEQFRRVANVFFLAIAILQFFSQFSTISPGLVILPLLAVLAITAGKDGYEDVKRHQADHKINHSIVHVLGGGEGYSNTNVSGVKSKTFVPAIPLPRKWSKKARQAKAEKKAGAKQEQESMSHVVPARENAPSGHTGHAGTLERVRSQADNVSTWEDDPEAGDSLQELGWQRTIWEDVKVGDIVKVYDNEQFPAGESSGPSRAPDGR